MTTAQTPRRRTAPLRADDVPDIAPRTAPVPEVPAPVAPGAIPTVGSVPPSPEDAAVAQAVQVANREVLTGLVILAVAALITFVWWRIAVADAAEDGSGNYMVFYGPMLYGGYRLLRGIRYRVNPQALLRR